MSGPTGPNVGPAVEPNMFDATALKYVSPPATEIVVDRKTRIPGAAKPSEIGAVEEPRLLGLGPYWNQTWEVGPFGSTVTFTGADVLQLPNAEVPLVATMIGAPPVRNDKIEPGTVPPTLVPVAR